MELTGGVETIDISLILHIQHN